MALVYLVNKPQASGIIARWLLFLKDDFTLVYKPSKTHVVANALSRLPNITKPIGVPKQTTNVSLFFTEPKWMNDIKEFLRTSQIEGTLFIQKKQRLVKRSKPFTLKNGELYKMGQYNKMRRYLTTTKQHMMIGGLHEGPSRGHLATDIKQRKILDAGYRWPTLYKDVHDYCKSYDAC
jgi:hypothetical protein